MGILIAYGIVEIVLMTIELFDKGVCQLFQLKYLLKFYYEKSYLFIFYP